MRWALALPLLGLALAGCLGQAPGQPLAPQALSPAPPDLLSQAVHPILGGESVRFESHDGTPLHAVVWRPDVPEGQRVPVILVMSPYHGHDAREDPLDPASPPLGRTDRWLIEHFVPRGYAVVFEDVRGTGESGGCLEQTGWKQQMDGYVSVEWFAAQPWSTGKVGMYGISYLGETQQGTAIHAPPSLVTIVPAASVSDGYRWWFYDAVPYWNPWVGGAFGYMVGDGLQAPQSVPGLLAYPQRPGCHPEMHEKTMGDGTHDAFWAQRDMRPHVDKVQASVLYVHGLQDWNVKPDHVMDWFNGIQAPKQAWLGQWAHNYPWRNSHESAWSRADWNQTVHRWFDHWLLGVENGVMGLPTVQVQDTEGRWWADASWPPADAEARVWHLAPDGALAIRAPSAAGSVAWEEQAERARGRVALGYVESFSPLFVPVGAPEALLGVPDGVRFESAPLEQALHMSGAPVLRLTVAADADDTHLAAQLLSIAPDGTETVVNRGYLSAAHRLDLAQPQPLRPGEPTPLTLTMFPQETVIPAGSRLALWLGPWDDWTRPEGNGAQVELRMGEGSESWLSIPHKARPPAALLDAPMYDWREGPPPG